MWSNRGRVARRAQPAHLHAPRLRILAKGKGMSHLGTGIPWQVLEKPWRRGLSDRTSLRRRSGNRSKRRMSRPRRWCVEAGQRRLSGRQVSDSYLTDTARMRDTLHTCAAHVCRCKGVRWRESRSRGFRSRISPGRRAFRIRRSRVPWARACSSIPRRANGSSPLPSRWVTRRTPLPEAWSRGEAARSGWSWRPSPIRLSPKSCRASRRRRTTTDTRSCSRGPARSRFARLRRWRCCAPNASMV